MSWFPASTTKSLAVNNALEKLNKNRTVPRVNLPALARRDLPFMATWQAEPGYVFVSSDFTSLEPSLTAEFSRDPNYLYATYTGIGLEPYIDHEGTLMIDDIYLMVASVMPGLRDGILKYFSDPTHCKLWVANSEAVKEDSRIKPLRKQAKPACLGFNYGMGPKRFVNQSYDAGQDVSLETAKQMYKAYWNLFPGIRELIQRLEEHIEKNKFLVNPFGYRLTTEPHKGYNAFIQSSASGVVDVFTYKFFSQTTDTRFEAFIHDEVIYQVPVNRLEETRLIQEACVTSLNKDLNFLIPMRLGFTTGKSFKELK